MNLQKLGHRLMMTTAPLAQTIIGLPLAVVGFTAGWALQCVAYRPGPAAPAGPDGPHLDEDTAALLD